MKNINKRQSIIDYIVKIFKTTSEKDIDGFLEIDYIEKIIKTHPFWEFIDTTNLIKEIKEDNEDKFIIENRKIKLVEFKQNSTTSPIKPGFMRIIPPKILYYQNFFASVSELKLNGIKPNNGQFVLLYHYKSLIDKTDLKFKSLVLEIDSFKAHQDGIAFYKESNNICFTSFIHPKYIRK